MKRKVYDLSYLTPSIWSKIKNFIYNYKNKRIPYLNLHMIETDETPWLVKLHNKKQLADYTDYRSVID